MKKGDCLGWGKAASQDVRGFFSDGQASMPLFSWRTSHGHGFKGSGLLLFYSCNSRLGFLALVTGVNALFKKFFCLFAPFSRIFQADSRVGAKGYAFFLALKAILETPPLAPAGGQLRDRGHRRQTAWQSLLPELRYLWGHGGNSV